MMLRLIFMLLALLFGVTFAQDVTVTTPDITELRQEALRLTLESKISELPASLQAEARGLLSRAQVLRDPVLAMRTKMLESYIAELEAGKEPYLAWATARNAVSEERLALLSEVVPLLRDIRAFVRDNPEVAPVFKELRENVRDHDSFRDSELQNFR
jgi:hypothetical protein